MTQRSALTEGIIQMPWVLRIYFGSLAAALLAITVYLVLRPEPPAPVRPAGQVKTEGQEWQYVCGSGGVEIVTDTVTGRRYLVVLGKTGQPVVVEIEPRQAEKAP